MKLWLGFEVWEFLHATGAAIKKKKKGKKNKRKGIVFPNRHTYLVEFKGKMRIKKKKSYLIVITLRREAEGREMEGVQWEPSVL